MGPRSPIPAAASHVRRIARYLRASLAMLSALVVAEGLILWSLGLPLVPQASYPSRTISRFCLRANGGGAAIFRFIGNVREQCWTEAMIFPAGRWDDCRALDCGGRAPIELACFELDADPAELDFGANGNLYARTINGALHCLSLDGAPIIWRLAAPSR